MKTRSLFQTMVLSVCMVSWISCSDTNSNLTSRITAKGITVDTKTEVVTEDNTSPIIFTGDDIAWFNTQTCEIKFRNIDPKRDFPLYRQIVFELDGVALFTAATMVSDVNSQAYTDLVLYYTLPTEENDYKGGYYLNDGYPDWAGEMEEAKENARKRANGWNQFITQLRVEGKIKDITNLNTKDGRIFEDYFVKSIAFDKEGNAWIGTFKQGLIKCNEEETQYFNSSNSLFTDEMVLYSVAVDRKNNVWIGSNSKGLIKYDGKKFCVFNTSNSPMPEDYIHSINIDSKDNLWFSSSRFRQGGLVKFDGKSKWEVFTPNNSKMTGNSIKSIAISKHDEVWVGLGDYVDNACLLKVSDGEMKAYSDKDFGFSPYMLGYLGVSSADQLYVSIDYSLSSTMLHDDKPNIFTFDGKTGKIIDCPLGDVRSMVIDSQDNLWYTGRLRNEIMMYDGSDWHAITLFPNEEDNAIFCIEEAPDGKIWVGTGNGIYIINEI